MPRRYDKGLSYFQRVPVAPMKLTIRRKLLLGYFAMALLTVLASSTPCSASAAERPGLPDHQ
jgi:hypothetical protein